MAGRPCKVTLHAIHSCVTIVSSSAATESVSPSKVAIAVSKSICKSVPSEAANTVIVFSDFQCTHCCRAHETLDRVLEKYPDRLRIAYRHYPQDPECNSNERFRVGGHPVACRAARAAEAARIVGGPGAYVRMRKMLYEHQDELSAKPYRRQTDQQFQPFVEWVEQ